MAKKRKSELEDELYNIGIEVDINGFPFTQILELGIITGSQTIDSFSNCSDVIGNLLNQSYHKGRVDLKKQVRRLFL